MTRKPPEIPALLSALNECEVEFVLAGSVAVQAWGADVGVPGDLDIVPATDIDNLSRLAMALEQVGAVALPVSGEWQCIDGQTRWREFPQDDPRRDIPLPKPDPQQLQTFDSLFDTIYGTLDIVPSISGTFDDLRSRATPMDVYGSTNVAVMSAEELLETLMNSQRPKDASRITHLRSVLER